MTSRHFFRRPAVALLAALAYGSLLGAAAAQESKVKAESPAPHKPAPNELQVFHLRFAEANGMLNILSSIREFVETGISFGADPRANAVIVSGPPAQMGKVKDLITKLDVERSAVSSAAARLKTFPLRHIEPDQYLEEALKIAVVPVGGAFAVDRPRKTVLVSGEQAAVDAAASLLASLDTPSARPQDLQVRVVWLVSGGEAPAPPDDLKDVLPALAKLGIDKPRLAAQTVVNTKPGAEFHAQGVTKIGPTYNQFLASGRLTDRPDGPDLQIHLQAVESGNPGAQQICSLQTQIAAPPGHLVVLGVTPTGSTTSVFIVQVLRPNAPKPVPQK
jgi:hypothetical protein